MRMTTESRIKIAVQKSGRLTEHSLELLVRCGLSYSRGKDQLICYGENMPVDVLLVTGERSALSYLVKPFTDQMAKAFREE